LRFFDFNDEWTKAIFSEVFETLSNNTLPRDSLNYDSGEIKNVHYGDVLVKFPTFLNVGDPEVPFIKNDVICKSDRLENGDVVIADTAEDYEVGKAIEIHGIKDIGVVAGLHTVPCRTRPIFATGYLGYYLNSKPYRSRLVPFIQGIKVYGISRSNLLRTEIAFPSLKEQTKIAGLLIALDKRIFTQNKIIEALETQRKQLRISIFKQMTGCEKTIGSILDYEQPTKYLVASDEYSDDASLTPVLTANKSFVLGYTNEEGIYSKGHAIILDDFTLDMKYVSFPFKVKSSAIKILTCESLPTLRFAYEYLSFLGLSSSEHKRHYISEVCPMTIPIPDSGKIRQIACLFERLEQRVKTEQSALALMKDQKQYLLKNLFI